MSRGKSLREADNRASSFDPSLFSQRPCHDYPSVRRKPDREHFPGAFWPGERLRSDVRDTNAKRCEKIAERRGVTALRALAWATSYPLPPPSRQRSKSHTALRATWPNAALTPKTLLKRCVGRVTTRLVRNAEIGGGGGRTADTEGYEAYGTVDVLTEHEAGAGEGARVGGGGDGTRCMRLGAQREKVERVRTAGRAVGVVELLRGSNKRRHAMRRRGARSTGAYGRATSPSASARVGRDGRRGIGRLVGIADGVSCGASAASPRPDPKSILSPTIAYFLWWDGY
ncbi:hypothetical protein B0H19DRAFT_1085575 [Mycena capillaripes]|nr:hypothetical protein B0H19DRAFT_1085575 [Mycena capillaripes]